MFIVFGEKQAKRKMGFVAERCPECSAVRSVRIIRVGIAPHIFWLPLGKGRLIGYYGECQQCGSDFNIDPTDYLSLSRKQVDSLMELQSMTNPKLDPNNRDGVAAFERFRRIRDPLLWANKKLQQRNASGTRFDKTSGLAFLATLAIPVVMFTADLSFLGSATQQAIGTISIWAFILGLTGSFVLVAREPRRFFRRELEPEIVKELQIANPRADELNHCLKLIKKYEYKVSEHVSAKRLLNQMQLQQFSFQ